MPENEKNMIGTPGQKKATRAMIKFCRDHQAPSNWIARLEELHEALDRKNLKELKEMYSIFRGGGMGSFIDWYPEVAHEGEDEDYVETIQWALSSYWHEIMRPIERTKA